MRMLLAVAVVTGLLAGHAFAADYVSRGLRIAQPWARPAAQGMNGAAYLEVTNTTKADDVLLAVEAPVARKADIHRSEVTGGMARMKALAGGIAVPAGKTIKLAPGGDHVMLSGLKSPLTVGGRTPMTLVFRKAGRIQVELLVQTSANAPQDPAPEHKH